MNCVPFDLAEVIAAGPVAANLIGERIVVTDSFTDGRGVQCWYYVTMDGKPLWNLYGVQITECEDHCLKPIRPDEQKDEAFVVASKPTPEQQIEAKRIAMAKRRERLGDEVPRQ